jgi:hypothetical protein
MGRIVALDRDDIAHFTAAAAQGLADFRAVLWRGDRIGTVVFTRNDDRLVVNCYAVDPVADSLPAALEQFDALATEKGLKGVRFWTRHKALARRAGAYGFTQEYVLERDF